jgi:hypothetical protein
MVRRVVHRILLAAPAAAAAALAFATSAAAAPIVFFGLHNSSVLTPPYPNADTERNKFVAMVGAASISTQDFESFSTGLLPTPSFDGVFANGVGVTVTNSATDFMRISPAIGSLDTHATSGQRFLETLSNQGTTYFTATFHQAVRAIGFYVTDASDWNCCGRTNVGELRVVLTTASGTIELDLTPGINSNDILNGNTAFFGVLDNTELFTSIAIRSDASNGDEDGIGIDDVMISVNAVPAPGTLPLVLGLLPLLGFLRRRPA